MRARRAWLGVMSKTTAATEALKRLGIAFSTASYDYDPKSQRVGLQAAEALGVEPGRVFKTLMVLLDDRPACAVLPSDEELNLKKLAAALGGRTARMMPPPDAERITGYKVGGISPFGQRRPVPTAIEETAQLYETIYLNGGQRGLQVVLAPGEAVESAAFVLADIIR